MRGHSIAMSASVLGVLAVASAAAARSPRILPGKIDIPVVRGGTLDEQCAGAEIDPRLDACVRISTPSVAGQLEAYTRVLRANRWVHRRPTGDDNVHVYRRDWPNRTCEGVVIQSITDGATAYLVFSYEPKEQCAGPRWDQ